ncbi:hypothetical protein GR198_05875 [Rhizobium leguminosarum]|uniref:hypothetical protein n=1 Tax=Rhizobium leguminosarum TaxID=384 RepID=UPI0013C28C41|nr:hypothetical protein [Rhizobium leguminosarum]NEH55274.1 hypothetical protein [Rhizobium leguminosarum]
MLRYGIIGICVAFGMPVFAQEVDPAPSGNEVEVLTINPDTGAAFSAPGEALTSQMPDGPQTEIIFPETPDVVSPDDTTVIFEPSTPDTSE